jgi:hypothetical protein
VHGPELLILDEPLAGLDPAGIDAISDVLAGQARAGCCVLFSSHQLDLVEDLCEAVTIIDHGRLVVTGKVDDLATSGPRRLVVRVTGDRGAAWARRIPGVTVSEVDRGAARLVLDESADSESVLRAAMAAGRVTEFVVQRRRLSEGSDLLHGTAPLVLVSTLVWLVLGYAFYCWVYAAAGSLAERQDQVQSLAFPLSLPIIFGYVISLTALGSGSPSGFFRVLAYLPPTAPFAMPVLVSLGRVTWWEFTAAAALSILCTVAVARVAISIYRRAILRTGRRVRLREVVSGGTR